MWPLWTLLFPSIPILFLSIPQAPKLSLFVPNLTVWTGSVRGLEKEACHRSRSTSPQASSPSRL